MAHLHEVRDTDSHFTVDPITRSIKNGTPTKSMLIQYDHNSEVFTFEMPRYVDGHDMTLCNRVEIHYININSSNRQQTSGVYEVEDFKVSEDDENIILWSWMISRNATMFVGPLNFAFRFACLDGEIVDYAWNTSPYSGITISSGIYNGEAVIEEYSDILEQWERKIGVGVEGVEQTIESTEENGVNEVTLILTDSTRHSFNVRNGKTPVRGTDYWTEEDKQAIINDILGVLPLAEEASF